MMRIVPLAPLILFLLASVVLSACQPSPRNTTVVSGKTVFGDLAIEDVLLKIHLWEDSGFKYIGDSRSGYHGSFRLHLAPGNYMITAIKTVRVGNREVLLTGGLPTLFVDEGKGRMDQIVIELSRGGKGSREESLNRVRVPV